MSYWLKVPPRRQISEFIVFALGQNGMTVSQIEKDIGRQIPGSSTQHQYKDMPVWHRRKDIIEYVAQEMKLHQSMWGDKRTSNEFYSAADQEISKLKQKNIMINWHKSGNVAIFRLDPKYKMSAKPAASLEAATSPTLQDSRTDDMKRIFLSIITQSRKDNTYKFALGRVLLEHCYDSSAGENSYKIPYTHLAKKFLEYYWHQECKFKIKQDFKTKSIPKVIHAIRYVFGENTPGDFSLIDEDDKAKAESKILCNVFGHARSKTSLVVPRFQKIMAGKYGVENQIFYDYDDDEKMIYLKPEAFDFFKTNYGILSKALLAEWAKFLEKINGSLPRLVAKIEQDEFERGSLTPFRKAYAKHTNHCFYCCDKLEHRYTHVDHFLPWSYIFEDQAWNLVLACQECNCKKSSSLPQQEFRDMLIRRNHEYENQIPLLRKSLAFIDTKIGWRSEIKGHYKNCEEYGFNVIKMP